MLALPARCQPGGCAILLKAKSSKQVHFYLTEEDTVSNNAVQPGSNMHVIVKRRGPIGDNTCVFSGAHAFWGMMREKYNNKRNTRFGAIKTNRTFYDEVDFAVLH